MMNTTNIVLLGLWISISLLLITKLWTRPGGTPGKKLLWTIALCLPLGGWLLYGALYDPLSESNVKANGKAGGMCPHWPSR